MDIPELGIISLVLGQGTPGGLTFLILAPFVLDLAIGDPPTWPHPVRFLGRIISGLERLGLKWKFPLIAWGAFSVVLVILVTGLVCLGLMNIPLVGPVTVLYLGFSGLALGSLLREGIKVQRSLAGGDLQRARQELGGLVSRDTGHMDEDELWKGLAETLTENLNDGFMAPLFYLVLAGPVGLWVYKCVSTFDSMWGYRTGIYDRLGRAGARLDDLLAYVPARITALAILAAGLLTGRNRLARFGLIAGQAGRMESPNAGWPMAAAAHVMDAPLGGAAVYFGKVKDKPILGLGSVRWDHQTITRLIKVLILSATLSILGFMGLLWAVGSFT